MPPVVSQNHVVSRRYASEAALNQAKAQLRYNDLHPSSEVRRSYQGELLVLFIFSDMADAAFAEMILR
jgi:hypothetical protein